MDKNSQPLVVATLSVAERCCHDITMICPTWHQLPSLGTELDIYDPSHLSQKLVYNKSPVNKAARIFCWTERLIYCTYDAI